MTWRPIEEAPERDGLIVGARIGYLECIGLGDYKPWRGVRLRRGLPESFIPTHFWDKPLPPVPAEGEAGDESPDESPAGEPEVGEEEDWRAISEQLRGRPEGGDWQAAYRLFRLAFERLDRLDELTDRFAAEQVRQGAEILGLLGESASRPAHTDPPEAPPLTVADVRREIDAIRTRFGEAAPKRDAQETNDPGGDLRRRPGQATITSTPRRKARSCGCIPTPPLDWHRGVSFALSAVLRWIDARPWAEDMREGRPTAEEWEAEVRGHLWDDDKERASGYEPTPFDVGWRSAFESLKEWAEDVRDAAAKGRLLDPDAGLVASSPAAIEETAESPDWRCVLHDAMLAIHKIHCGDPPSCGSTLPCREAQVNECEIELAVKIALAAQGGRVRKEVDDAE